MVGDICSASDALASDRPYLPAGTLIMPKPGDAQWTIIMWSSPPWMSKGRRKPARMCFNARLLRFIHGKFHEITNATGLMCKDYGQRMVTAE